MRKAVRAAWFMVSILEWMAVVFVFRDRELWKRTRLLRTACRKKCF